MNTDPSLQPFPADFKTASLQKINQLYFNAAPSGVDPNLAPVPTDEEHASLQKINQLLWIGHFGPWTPCTYPPGCSGTLQARTVGDPDIATIEIIGQASSVSQWDSTYTFVLAHLPEGLAPSEDRFVIVPSSYTTGIPDAISCAQFKPTGEIVMGIIYKTGQNSLIAWFGGVSIQK